MTGWNGSEDTMRIPRVPQSLPKTVSTHYHRKRNPAISPRRRRITEFGKPNSVSRSQTISSCLGRRQIGEQIDLHKLHPSTFFPKVLRSAMNPWIHWFISDRLPPSPRPPSPISIRIYSLNIAISSAMPDSILEESLAKAEAMSALPLPIFCSRAARISPQLYT